MDYGFEFTLIQVYRSAQLLISDAMSTVTTIAIVGDDTGYVHIAANQTVHLTEVSVFKSTSSII